MDKKDTRFRLIDALYIALMVLPLLGCMILKVLTTPQSEGISITGAQIYLTIPMPLMDLTITASQINSWAVMISILGLCLYMTHGLTVKPGSKTLNYVKEMQPVAGFIYPIYGLITKNADNPELAKAFLC